MIVFHCGKPKFISLPVSPPIYRSKSAKFRLCTTVRSITIFSRTALPHLCFVLFVSKFGGRNNVKYAFQDTFNNNTTQNAKNKKKKRKNNVWTFTTMFAVGHPSSSKLRPTWLNLSAVTKPSFARISTATEYNVVNVSRAVIGRCP